MQSLSTNPLDKGRTFNVLKTFRRCPECLMCVQFRSCIQWTGPGSEVIQAGKLRTDFIDMSSQPINAFF